jgi:hypothetical protein
MTHRTLVLTLSIALGTVCTLGAEPAQAQWQSWMLGPFEKPKTVNPVITPGNERMVVSPFNDSLVRWEG